MPDVFRLPRAAAALSLAFALAWLPAAGAAVDEADLLPVDQAFALSARAAGADRIALEWKIADGYYLYRHRIKATSDDARLGSVALPRGEAHEDEFFGRVETFRRRLAGSVPVLSADGSTVTLKVSYQGCADLGVCYPPQTRTLAVAMPGVVGAASAARSSQTTEEPQKLAAEAAPTSHSTSPGGSMGDAGFAALGRSLGAPAGAAPLLPGGQAAPLPSERAFGFDAIADGPGALRLRFTPAPGYYLYRDHTRLQLDAAGIALEAPRWPPGKPYRDEHFGQVVVYFDQVEVPVPLRRQGAGAAAQELVLTATFQGCQDEGICYPPMTRRVALRLPAASVDHRVGAASAASSSSTAGAAASPMGATGVATSETADAGGMTSVVPAPGSGGEVKELAAEAAPTAGGDASAAGVAASAAPTETSTTGAGELAEDTRLAAALSGPGRWTTLLWFFLGGLALAFTPCVLPMIPILSGLIAGAGTRLGTGRALWLSFVYVLANALVFTAAGVVAGLLGANLQAAFQVPWVIALFAALFVALALSSFGLYELQLPTAVRARLGRVSERQRGGSLAGVAAMGALSALIVGPCVAPPLAAAVLYIGQNRDPVFGGLALFALAMGMGLPLLAFGAAAGRGMPTSGPWMTGVQRAFGFVFLGLAAWMLSRVLPGPAALALYGAIALAAAAWAFGGTRSEGARLRWLARFAGLLLAVLGAAWLFGALAGNGNPLRPLAGAGTDTNAAQSAPAFRTIKSVADLDRELTAAQAAGKPVLFDFYADWCVACKEMEAYTFTDPAVGAALSGFVLLKADVTANDAVDQALMRRFGIIGPPATLFFHGSAAERRGLRLVGFERAGPFVERVRRAAEAR